jgi:aryl-alcohol dehydrogenase-like predicted oxidoreductase
MAEQMGIVFGTMTFGPRCTQEQSYEILKEVEKYTSELDTALMYGNGNTEVRGAQQWI